MPEKNIQTLQITSPYYCFYLNVNAGKTRKNKWQQLPICILLYACITH